MGLTMHEKKSVSREYSRRYQRSNKRDKSVLLNEFIELTGYRRDYASFLLRNWGKRVSFSGGRVILIGDFVKRRSGSGRKKKYGEEELFVLLQFWAAEDRGSRIINPVLVEAYKKYKKKGFEIYQVSVGTTRIEWVDAIDTDKLSWINVGDMNGSIHAVNVYNVQQIPFNYLLNEEGIIVAKNLKGPALNKTLARVFK